MATVSGTSNSHSENPFLNLTSGPWLSDFVSYPHCPHFKILQVLEALGFGGSESQRPQVLESPRTWAQRLRPGMPRLGSIFPNEVETKSQKKERSPTLEQRHKVKIRSSPRVTEFQSCFCSST